MFPPRSPIQRFADQLIFLSVFSPLIRAGIFVLRILRSDGRGLRFIACLICPKLQRLKQKRSRTSITYRTLTGMPLSRNGLSCVPPGFRFHPTDEELLYYYLKKKVSCEKIDLDVIKDVDLNKLEPWDLHERCKIGSTPQNEWYFFSHKDKKYPTGTRTNRATAAGFWKATGRDKSIHMNSKRIGMRKTLVFYTGRAPRGQKTEWIMHEYRLEDNENPQGNDDGWVVCRVFKKRFHQKSHHSEPTISLNCELEQSIDVPELHCPPEALQFDQRLYSEPELHLQYYTTYPQHQFMQLPQLESPKLTPCNPTFSSSAIQRFLENFSNGHPPQLSMDRHMTEIQGSMQIKFSTANEFTEERSNDWTVLDTSVASHFNQEAASKEVKDVVPQFEARFNAVQLPTRGTGVYAHNDYSGCEMDLWNLGK